MRYHLEKRVEVVARHLDEVGDHATAHRVRAELSSLRSILRGEKTSSLVNDLTAVRGHLRQLEAALLSAHWRMSR